MAISDLIPNQRFEEILDRIGLILTTEFLSQYELSDGATPKPTIYKERIIAFNPSETPALNISLAEVKYNNKDAASVDGLYTFNIECYATAKTTGSTRGDYSAAVVRNRILGMVRAILENPLYNTLNYAPPYLAHTEVSGITLIAPANAVESIFESQAYLQFFVRVPEGVELQEADDLLLSTTVVKLYNTNVGYLWGDASEGPPEFIVTEEDVFFIAE